MTIQKTTVETAMRNAQAYIDALTVQSDVNRPNVIVHDEHRFFTWDNEERTPSQKPYLFDWSYYNGVVMEGLYDIYEAEPKLGDCYRSYVREYLDAMITADENGKPVLDRNLAGYVDHHGADCYKTAALLMKITNGNDVYMELASSLYRDLTDRSWKNSVGVNVPSSYTEEALGGNYWHSWAGGTPPKYKVWLDGIYMLQPFLAHFAAKTGDQEQLALVKKRFDWVAETLLAPNGIYYHACNSKEDVCPYHWTRAIGWYGMAMVDVMEVLPEEYLEDMKAHLKLFVEGMMRYQQETGLWTNVTDWPVTEGNRLETSGTAMMSYTILKGVRNGWLDESFQEAGIRAFLGMTEGKLDGKHLNDIYLKASANNTNNYEDESYYLPDEGKGAGPYLMAYSEMLYTL